MPSECTYCGADAPSRPGPAHEPSCPLYASGDPAESAPVVTIDIHPTLDSDLMGEVYGAGGYEGSGIVASRSVPRRPFTQEEVEADAGLIMRFLTGRIPSAVYDEVVRMVRRRERF